MKLVLTFVCGMVAGALLLYAIGFRSESSVRKELKQELLEKLKSSLLEAEEDVEVQYVEVKGKKGNVTLHTGMSKDSVAILVGKPDKVSLRTYGATSREDWGYRINSTSSLTDLDLDFEDGRLISVRQY